MPNHPSPATDEQLEETTLANQVTGKIERLVVDRDYRPGDRLPAERELARQFGVSRTVIREAVRVLAANGLLEVRRGSGTIICSPSVKSVSRTLSLFLRGGQRELDYRKVLEVRFLLEVEIAGLAAERRTAEDLDKMERILKDTPGVQTRQQFVEVDIAFHAALAEATRNELYTLLLDSIGEVMRRVRELAWDIREAGVRAYQYHSAILDQVREGNRAGARQAMREHLYEAESTIQRALAFHALKAFEGERPDEG